MLEKKNISKLKITSFDVTLAAAFCSVITIARVALAVVPARTIVGLIIITGICLGPFFGVTVGITSILVSNIIIGHGVWTLLQMFGISIIGFMSGLFFKNTTYNKNKILLIIWCVLSAIIYAFFSTFCYSLFMINSVSSKPKSLVLERALIYYISTGMCLKDIMTIVSTNMIVLWLTEPIEKMINLFRNSRSTV